ncbi:hypothetical protein Ae201684P_011937 [Aphanomyces euteiches]|nr:hypothetical protein Ae201684P_011937 [Aphanomyces euteiches]
MPSSKRLTLQKKDSIRQYYKSMAPQRYTTVIDWTYQQYGIKPHITTIRRILKDNHTCDYANINEAAANKRCYLRMPKFPELGSLVYAWVTRANAQGACITGAVIVRKALQFANELHIDGQVLCSVGWLVNFQRRHNLKMHRLHGEAMSVDPKTVEDGRKQLLIETSMYDKRDIYNMDETGLFYNYQPCTTITNVPRNGQKKDKRRISVALTTNADGTHKLSLLFIGKAQRPRCFGSMSAEQLGFLYRNNRKAWMTSALFSGWINDVNMAMERDNCSILLILDNASSHSTVRVNLINVVVLMLPPNTTSVLQPMDAGIIASFKQNYRRRQVDHAIQLIDNGLPDCLTKEKNLYAVDVRTAMEWSLEAWNDVSLKTIQNCWDHTGIVSERSLSSQVASLTTSSGHSIELLLND